MKKAVSLFIVLFVFSAIIFAAEQENLKDASVSLNGLSAVGIRVDTLPADALRYGLRAEELAAIAKAVLDKSEIKVLMESERSGVPGKPYLLVVIGLIADDSSNTCALSLELSLWQQGKLIRDDKIEPIDVRTWHVRSLAITQPGMSLPGVQSRLAEDVSLFIKDWCEANGKKPPKVKKKASV